MATLIYPSSSLIGVFITTPSSSGTARLGRMTRGTGAVSTNVSITGSSFVTIGIWATRPLAGFTFSGSVTANLRASVSNAQANAGISCRFYRWVRATNTLSSQLLQISSTSSLTTSEVAYSITGTPAASTTFADGDILVMEVGTVLLSGASYGNGRSATFYYSGPTANATGDSYVNITENVTIRNRSRITT